MGKTRRLPWAQVPPCWSLSVTDLPPVAIRGTDNPLLHPAARGWESSSGDKYPREVSGPSIRWKDNG